jgi:hypothetical protein
LQTGFLHHIPSTDSTAWQCWPTLQQVIRVYIISFSISQSDISVQPTENPLKENMLQGFHQWASPDTWIIASYRIHLAKKIRHNYSQCDGIKYFHNTLPKMVLNQMAASQGSPLNTSIHHSDVMYYTIQHTHNILFIQLYIYLRLIAIFPLSCMCNMSVVCTPAIQCTFYIVGKQTTNIPHI